MTFKQYILCLFVTLLLAIGFVGVKAYIEKVKFDQNIENKLKKSDIYYSLLKEKDFYANNKDLEKSLNPKKYEGFGLTMNTIEISNFKPYQIISKTFRFTNITYLKDLYKTEKYYDQGVLDYDSYGIPFYKDGGFKERIVPDERISPNEIYQSAWDYYTKEMKSHNAEVYNGAFWEFLVETSGKYYGLIKSENINDEIMQYRNEYFNLNITCTLGSRWEASFFWYSMGYDVIIYFIFLSIIPIGIMLCLRFGKMHFVTIWIFIHYIFLFLSEFEIFNRDNSRNFSVLWPFSGNIIDWEYKQKFLGNLNAIGSAFTSAAERVYTVHILQGYDFTDFLIYCFLGYIIYLIIKKIKKYF